MQFLLMCCFDETRWNAIPVAERDRIMRDYNDFVQTHIDSGHYVTGGKLSESTSAITVRRPHGKLTVTDGPFAETKEQLGGYHLIECANLKEALAVAQQIPTLPAGGTVEVRPMLRQLGART